MGKEVITQDLIDGWVAVLEDWLPGKIDGMTGEGADTLLKHEYVPHTVRVAEILDPPSSSLTKCYLVITYRVKQVTVGEAFENLDLRGAVEIPVGWNDVLLLEDVDPLDGVLNVGEGLTDLSSIH